MCFVFRGRASAETVRCLAPLTRGLRSRAPAFPSRPLAPHTLPQQGQHALVGQESQEDEEALAALEHGEQVGEGFGFQEGSHESQQPRQPREHRQLRVEQEADAVRARAFYVLANGTQAHDGEDEHGEVGQHGAGERKGEHDDTYQSRGDVAPGTAVPTATTTIPGQELPEQSGNNERCRRHEDVRHVPFRHGAGVGHRGMGDEREREGVEHVERADVLGQHDDKPEEMRHHPRDLAQPISHWHVGAYLQKKLGSEHGDAED